MECTQKLECTQNLYESQCDRICQDQIGFIGICGTKYPVKRGPNKIGRDPQTCNIVLNLNSVSRQHAVINILNSREFMLMDLDSANKTKLIDKTLQPYIPHPLKNGDTVQFGQVFGVFRLLEEETDLPMTQALDIPETPVFAKHMSRFNNAPITLVPESPDVSDKDDSFIIASQTKPEKHSNNNFIKPSGKPIAIQPVGSKKIDNIYWTSSRKSASLGLRLDDSNNSLNESTSPVKCKSSNTDENKDGIHDMDTQDLFPKNENENRDSIHSIETQTPLENDNISIHELCTQVPDSDGFDPGKVSSIHNINTQFPDDIQILAKEDDKLIYEVDTQDLNLDDLDAEKKPSIHYTETQLPDRVQTLAKQENKLVPSPSNYSLETQLPVPLKDNFVLLDEDSPIDFNESQSINILETQDPCLFNYNASKICSVQSFQGEELRVDNISMGKDESIFDAETQVECVNMEPVLINDNNYEKKNSTGKIKVFDEVPLHTIEPGNKIEENDSVSTEYSQKIKPLRRSVRIESDESTDCEDICIMPTQKVESKEPDDDLTDCEDDIFGPELKTAEKSITSKNITNSINLQDQPTQVLKEVDGNDDDLQDMLTQVIDEDIEKFTEKEANFEDLLTQKLEEPNDENVCEQLPVSTIEQQSVNINDNEDNQTKVKMFVSPFKVPIASPRRAKRSSKINTPKQDETPKPEAKLSKSFEEDNERYYKDTQDIFDDLCSQKHNSPEIIENLNISEQPHIKSSQGNDGEPVSVDDYKFREQIPQVEKASSPKNKCKNSLEQSEEEENVKKYVSGINTEQVRDIIGSETDVAIVKESLSDPSDVEVTPKKLKPFRLMKIELPNSQEIKTGVSFNSRASVTGSSSESEAEQNDSEECTPILYKKRTKKSPTNAKIDLTKKFDIETLPSRVSTRTRKPTTKLQNGDGDALKVSKSILKSKFISDQEENIDSEIIIENITRLRNKSKHSKHDPKSMEQKRYQKKSLNTEDTVDGATEVVVESIIKKPEPKRRGRPPKGNILKKTTEDAIVSEIIKVIKSRDSKSNNETDGKNEMCEPKSDKRSNSTSDKPKRSSGRRKSSSQKEDTGDIDKKRKTDSKKEDKSTKNKTDSKKNVKEEVKKESIKEKPKRVNKKQANVEILDLSSPEKEAESRRSKRQRTKATTKSKDTKPQHDQDKGRKFEQSTVYNMSSESGNDSPRNLKRSFTGEAEVPSAKRSRSNVSANSSLRSTPARAAKKHFLLFTAFPCEEVRVKLEKLGVVIVTDVTKCTVLLTLQIKRTFKLLCAVGLGVPIVGPNWVQACSDTNMIVDPWLYLIKDEAAEKRFLFNLERTLTGKRSFLSGYNISSTPSVMPASAEMKLIVECSGGVWKPEGPQWICVSCAADKAQWPSIRRKGAIIVSTEFILGGVLRQKVDIEKNKFK